MTYSLKLNKAKSTTKKKVIDILHKKFPNLAWQHGPKIRYGALLVNTVKNLHKTVLSFNRFL